MKWKKISSKSVYKDRWMEVTEDIVETDSGKTSIYGVIHKEPCALVIPWDGKYLHLVGQYRIPVECYSWDFPTGYYEHESLIETAKAELREETGLEAKNIEKIGEVNIAPGHHTQVCHVFIATKLKEVENSPDLWESMMDMKVKKVTLQEFKNEVNEGIIKDGPTLAAFGIASAKGLFK